MEIDHVQFGFSVEKKEATPSLIRQVHGNKLVEFESFTSFPDADAIFTRGAEDEIYVFSADCLPVLFYSETAKDPIAAVHSGWRGAKKGVVSATLELLMKEGSGPYHAVLGPCLQACCFEVRQDFIDDFEEERGSIQPFLENRFEKRFFDLVGFVKAKELNRLPSEQIHLQHTRCTYCSQPELPSYRRNGGTDPRIRAWIRKR